MGLLLRGFAYVNEKLGSSPPRHCVFNCQAPDIAGMDLLLCYGSEAQKAHYLVLLARGYPLAVYWRGDQLFADHRTQPTTWIYHRFDNGATAPVRFVPIR